MVRPLRFTPVAESWPFFALHSLLLFLCDLRMGGHYLMEMMMSEDAQLLRRYAVDHSEAAFTELIQRHVDLVYSAGLRLLNGDAHGAQDLTQQVFSELARQAKPLSRHPALVGWLYTTTRRMAWRGIRSEQRRAAREKMAHTMNELLRQPAAEPDWDQLGPALDEAMHELSDADRLAVLLRFFKSKSLREVGLALGLTENAARMRVERALEKLRLGLARKGVTSTAAALALALSANAVIPAPAGLAATLAGTVLAGAAGQTGTTLSMIKFMAATKLKIGLSALVIAGAAVMLVLEHQARLNAQADNDALRRQLAQLKADSDALASRRARVNQLRSARLSAPGFDPNASGTARPGTPSSGNLYDRLVNNPVAVAPSQLEEYLKTNHRSAASLLAAFRVTHDPAMLAEAMQKFPNDPQVDFEAALQTNATPEDRRQWLNAFEKSAPDNALANYLSALDYFKAGQSDLAVQEMTAAASKTAFQDYTTDRYMDDKDAYLAAGLSPAEAEVSSSTQLLLPQLQQMKDLGLDLVDLSKSYAQAGDDASAQTTLQLAAALGQRYAASTPGEPEISQLVGMAVEQIALKAMDPNASYGANGQTVQDQLNQITQERAALNTLNDQATPLMPSLTDQDWIIYKDHWMVFGEQAALRWVIGKYGPQ